MIIKRDILLNKLIRAKNHHLIKILVGIRRCGKSFLLFNLFKQHLLDSGIPEAEARQLQMIAFLAPVLRRLPEPLAEEIYGRLS